MPFTEAELAFLTRHRYSSEDVYDGRDQAKVTWQAGARAAGKDIVLATPCTKPAGHRLKTRAGHCFQCDPKKIAFVRRETVPGYVYIAGTLKGRLVKIGMFEESLSRREYKIRYDRYGGFDDWVILYTVKVNDAGRVERVARERLRQHRVLWREDGSLQPANELLQCSFSKAREALTAVVGERVFGTLRSPHYNDYGFD